MAGESRLRRSTTSASGFSGRGPARPAFDPHAIALHLPIAFAQRNQHAAARLDLVAEGVGNEVVELLGRPRGEHDPGNELLRLVVGLPGLGLGVEEATLLVRHGGGKLKGE